MSPKPQLGRCQANPSELLITWGFSKRTENSFNIFGHLRGVRICNGNHATKLAACGQKDSIGDPQDMDVIMTDCDFLPLNCERGRLVHTSDPLNLNGSDGDAPSGLRKSSEGVLPQFLRE